MSQKNQVDDLIAFGKNARNILDDATFKAVIQSVKDDIHISWKQTSPHAVSYTHLTLPTILLV